MVVVTHHTTMLLTATSRHVLLDHSVNEVKLIGKMCC